jgi:leucyl aminopeptidase
MKITSINQSIENHHAECEIVLISEEEFTGNDELARVKFEAKEEQTALLMHKNQLYVGVGTYTQDNLRIAASTALKTLDQTNYKSAKVAGSKEYAQALAEGFALANYTFNRYKSEKKPKDLEELFICSNEDLHQEIDRGIKIADATNLVKEVINQTPDDMTPANMAAYASEMAQRLHRVECTVHDETFLQEQAMHAFLAVSRASAHPPRLIELTYKPKNPKAKIAIVGKGLTYDSGGLSLKPSEYMVTMKADKSGGSAVLGIIQGASELGLDVEIHGIIGATENMIGGDAYKPDDVLIAKNGTTIEIRNTDAEGRLVLADCLSYVCEREGYDYILDIATLTGACVVAVGEYTTGIMGHNSELKDNLLAASEQSGELFGRLEFNRYLKKLIKSEVADISNVASSRYGGAITAGLFLNEFISKQYKEKWCHIDIAGPAYVEKPWGYNQAGASGASVRTLLYWMRDL